MALNFKQSLCLAIIAGTFGVVASVVSAPKNNVNPPQQIKPAYAPYATAISNGGEANANATVNINNIDNRTMANNGGTAVNIRNESNSSSSIIINGQSFNQ